jgi:predicted phage terminase large subunit-like protein
MTRWHEDDLTGRLHANMDCRHINIPLEAELDDVLGRQLGDSLFPEIGKDNAWLEDFKNVYMTEQGTRAWNALMQGRPSSAEGNLFKRAWWQRYTLTETMLNEFPVVVMSVDATFKGNVNNDNVAIGVWGKIWNRYYLIDAVVKKMDFVETIQAIQRLLIIYPMISAKYIEDKANGSAIISVLNRQIGGFIGINPKGSKEARAQSVLPYIESGNVYLPMEHVADELIEEAASFPNGKHDDMVDMTTQALYELIYRHADIPEEPYTDNLIMTQEQYDNRHKLRPVSFKGAWY